MKKILILLLSMTLFIVSCAKDNPYDDGILNTNKSNMPSWIIGTWSDQTHYWIFSSDNVILSIPSFSYEVNFGEVDVVITENVVSDNEYKFSMSYNDSDVQTYRFVKTSSTTLNYFLTTAGFTQGPFVQTKQ